MLRIALWTVCSIVLHSSALGQSCLADEDQSLVQISRHEQTSPTPTPGCHDFCENGRRARNVDWNVKCFWNKCNQCDECTTQCVDSCRPSEFNNRNTWELKCVHWYKCLKCPECDTGTCEEWCSNRKNDWRAKCTWLGCKQCVECTTGVCQSWCTEPKNGWTWAKKCELFPVCRACPQCPTTPTPVTPQPTPAPTAVATVSTSMSVTANPRTVARLCGSTGVGSVSNTIASAVLGTSPSATSSSCTIPMNLEVSSEDDLENLDLEDEESSSTSITYIMSGDLDNVARCHELVDNGGDAQTQKNNFKNNLTAAGLDFEDVDVDDELECEDNRITTTPL